MSTFDPPFAPRTPITARDPSRPLRGVDWQYGFAFRGPHTALQADAPPVRSMALVLATLMAWWTPQSWNAQSAPVFTPSGPPPVVQTPAPNIPAFYAIRQSWVDATWSAQSAPDFIPPPAGDEPPGQVTGGAEAPNLAAYGYFDGWRAQSAPPVAALIPPPVIAYIPPAGFPYAQILAWQAAPVWGAQSEPDGAPYATIVYGQNPPITSIAGFAAIRSGWADATWSAQTQPDVAGSVPPPVTNQPTPVSIAVITAVRASWPDPVWSTQRPFSPIAPLTLSYGQQPPVYSIAPFTALRATWLETTWSEQSEPAVAGFIPAVITAQVPYSLARTIALRAAWTEPTWSAQSFAATAGSIPPPRVDQPQPRSFARQYAVRMTWTEAQWSAQSALHPSAQFAPVLLVPTSGQATTVYGEISITIRGPDSTTVYG